MDNPFEYHGGEGLIDARIYFPPGNGNGRNVTTDPLLKACPQQSQVKCHLVRASHTQCCYHRFAAGASVQNQSRHQPPHQPLPLPGLLEILQRPGPSNDLNVLESKISKNKYPIQPTMSERLHWSASNPWSLHHVCRVLQGAPSDFTSSYTMPF